VFLLRFGFEAGRDHVPAERKRQNISGELPR